MLRQERCGWQNPRPTWWLLYVIGALLVAVVGLVEMFVDGQGPARDPGDHGGGERVRAHRSLAAAQPARTGAGAGAAPDMMLTYLTVLTPYLTTLGRAALAARPWLRRVPLP